ncbi:glycosyltransferase [Maridesulfovibrio sp.]|uniref:glycosyltransferase family protein n=1 Tax=Maridesulfovibrio sp. TaxID=2795000 RepID=UPI002A187A1B|nr:glycosyltransferase [Maridesulfovibrio sp.]
MQRPKRIRVKNESGRIQSLPEGKEYFQDLGGTGRTLLLGLGPVPESATELLPEPGRIYYVESPDFEKQIELNNLPKSFTRITPEEMGSGHGFHIFLYTPGKKLFPSFWGPIISKLVLERSGVTAGKRSKTAWLPGTENSLLLPELSRALNSAGFRYRVIAPDAMRNDLLSMLDRELPELVISVNFNGLDASGETYFMLREAGVKTVVWMVDNPFHIISGIRSEYWKQVPLMVTDHWFIPHLKQLGACRVEHLPLATDPAIFNPGAKPYPGLSGRTVFVGRSGFPDKKTFFSGCSFSDRDLADAVSAIQTGTKPDFEWWCAHDGLVDFWPDSAVRKTGFRAEQSGLLWRTTALRQAGERLTLFGDDGWKDHLPTADLRGPVDYYTVLPSVYAGAGLNLNMTSPLLPYGLTQRNFDVWAAGGILISDRTPGFSIFPAEITGECTFSSPDEIPALCDKFLSFPSLAKTLSKIWLRLIMEKHTYEHRLNNILNFIH